MFRGFVELGGVCFGLWGKMCDSLLFARALYAKLTSAVLQHMVFIDSGLLITSSLVNFIG